MGPCGWTRGHSSSSGKGKPALLFQIVLFFPFQVWNELWCWPFPLESLSPELCHAWTSESIDNGQIQLDLFLPLCPWASDLWPESQFCIRRWDLVVKMPISEVWGGSSVAVSVWWSCSLLYRCKILTVGAEVLEVRSGDSSHIFKALCISPEWKTTFQFNPYFFFFFFFLFLLKVKEVKKILQ